MSRNSPKNDATTFLTATKDNIIKTDNKFRKRPNEQSLNAVKYSSTMSKDNGNNSYNNYDNTNFETQNNEIGIDSILDRLNLKIIEELLNNGEIKCSEIASKLKDSSLYHTKETCYVRKIRYTQEKLLFGYDKAGAKSC